MQHSVLTAAFDCIRVGLKDGNHVAKDAHKSEEKDEGARDEASQEKADEHGLGRCQEGSVCQHRIKERVT